MQALHRFSPISLVSARVVDSVCASPPQRSKTAALDVLLLFSCNAEVISLEEVLPEACVAFTDFSL